MRFIIYAPAWHHRSAGLKVLYNLQKELILRGYDCIYYPIESKLTAMQEVTADDIVIYPEIIFGNPLEAKHIMRYVLYYPSFEFSQTEKIYTYLPKYYLTKNQLTIPCIESCFIDNNSEKKHNCIWIYKGFNKKKIDLEGIEITPYFPTTKKELIKLLQECDTLFSYDENSLLCLEAQKCGAKVKIIQSNGNIIDYIYHDYSLNYQSQLDEFISEAKEWVK